MEQQRNGDKCFTFAGFKLNTLSRSLYRGDQEIHLAQRPFDILLKLVENRERVVSRAELLDEFWDGHEVYDDALRKCVGSIRKALHDTARPARFIETRYGGGYRFIADVQPVDTKHNGFRSEVAQPGQDLLSNSRTPPKLNTFSIYPNLRPVAVAATLFLITILTLGFYVFVPRQEKSVAASEAGDPMSRIRTIAVMPLKNLTGRPENDYFSDGVTDSIITELARSRELQVISRGSTFSLKGKEIDPREIGSQLGVGALLEGSVQSKGDLVNVRVRLVDTRDGRILWTSNDFEREFSSAYDLQDMIACNVASELRTELCGATPNKKTHSGLAYQEYLKGRYEWNKRDAAGIRKSIDHYRRAIAIDPTYALAYAGMSESYLQGIWHVPFDSAEALPKALENALTAVKLDDSLAEAHTALASVYSLQWNWDESDRELARAIELNPRYARAYHTQAFGLMIKGRFEESLASIDRAAELDPLNLVISTDKANLLLAAGRTEEAFKQWERTFAIDPDFTMAREHRLVAYEFVGNDAAAIDENAAIMQSRGESKEKIAVMRAIGSRKGFSAVRQLEYNALLAKSRRGEYVAPVTMANYCSLLGKKDEAFAWLQKAVLQRSAEIVLIVSPQFSGIQDDPRYTETLSRIGLR